LFEAGKQMRLYEVTYTAKKSVTARLLSSMQLATSRAPGDKLGPQFIEF